MIKQSCMLHLHTKQAYFTMMLCHFRCFTRLNVCCYCCSEPCAGSGLGRI